MSMIKIRHQAIFVASILWLIHSVPVQGQTLSQFLTWNYKSANMGLYLPPSMEQNPPIVMYLHYCTGNPVYENFWIIPALNAIEPTAIFLPTALAEVNTQYSCADWGGTYDQALRSNMINALHELDSLIRVYGLDSSRIYLYGESMGGEGVYRLLMDFPARFAGAIVASGYTVNKGAKQMASTPLWIFHGSLDQTASVDNARTIYQSIQDSGGTLVKYTEYEGYDHVPAMNKVHSEDGVLEWLLSNKRVTTGMQYAPLNLSSQSGSLVHFKDGCIQFSPIVHLGSVFSLYSSSGVLLYKGAVTNHTMHAPSILKNQKLYWRLKQLNQSSTGTFGFIE